MGEGAAVADRVGVVGANPNRGWARDSHIPALRSLENVPLAAVATTSRASADAAAEAIGVGAGYDDPRCVVPCGVCVDRLIRRRVQVHVDCLSVSFGPTVGRPLLTAALAADHHLTLVHYDADFDTAATVLEFQHQWVLPRGSLEGSQRHQGAKLTLHGQRDRWGRNVLAVVIPVKPHIRLPHIRQQPAA